MTRILLYTGKGGVGKTSIAAATALLCADARLPHDRPLDRHRPQPRRRVRRRRSAPSRRRSRRTCGARSRTSTTTSRATGATIQNYVAELFAWRGLDEVLAEEMTVLPGMDELGNLLWIADHVDPGKYDVIVVDAAPTGETLRLLSLPEASRWWVERIAPIGRRVTPDRPADARADARRADARATRSSRPPSGCSTGSTRCIGCSPTRSRSSVRIALALEKLSIVEAQRSFTYFHLFGYPSDLVVANRVLPAGCRRRYFAGLRETQQRYLPMVEQEFAPVPVRTVPQFDHEMVGLERLREIGEALFGDGDPTAVLYRGRPYQVQSRGRAVRARGRAAVHRARRAPAVAPTATSSCCRSAAWRRTLVLPRALVDAPTKGAKMDDGTLRIQFEAAGQANRRSEEDDDDRIRDARPAARPACAGRGRRAGLAKDERLAELEARLRALEGAPSLRERGRS